MSHENDFPSSDVPAALETFVARGLVAEVLGPVKSGKEATVYCCRAGPSQSASHFAAKVYRPRTDRSFKNDAVYQEGRWTWRLASRATRAYNNKSGFGREVQFAAWVGHEWETLRALHEAAVAVPRPIAAGEGAILMEFFGDGPAAAAPLHAVRLEPEEAQRVYDFVLANVERMLARNVVHGDLSPYNILYSRGSLRIIDFPQAVDARFNGSALDLLRRDIENVHRHCARHGARGDPWAAAISLWERFREGRL